MVLPEDSPSPAPRPTSARLRQLWETGHRGRAIRAALGGWEQLIGDGDDLGWLQEALRTCGLRSEAFAVQAHIARRQGAPAWRSLIRSVLQSGDPWWARELLDEAGSDSRELRALRIEAELAVGDPSLLIAAWLRDHRDEAALEAAVGWWVRSGRIDEAERLLQESSGLTLWRARFAIWRNQPRSARALLAELPSTSEARCLEAVATVQDGRLAEAESRLRALLDSEVRAEAGSWLATVFRKQGRYAEAVQAADAASIASPAFNLAIRLERELSATAMNVSTVARLLQFIGLCRGRMSQQVNRRTIGELEHAEVLYPLGVTPRDPIRTLETVLERFGGNHTPSLTITDQGRLASYRLPPDPRELGANIQLVLWTRGPAAARALYAELARRVHAHPLFLIYQGELELWMGEYAEAERIFREILQRAPTTKWAWIGLGASAMFQGRLGEAQTIWEEGISRTRFAGPTLYVYRGECFRLQGAMDRARRDLEFAVRQKPQRISGRINLALLQGASEPLTSVVQECEAMAPLLMQQLSGSPAEKLESVLAAMRGNRSSSIVSYHLWGRVWRAAT